MARRSSRSQEPVERVPIADRLRDAAAPWLEQARSQLAAARRAGRLPHAIMVHGQDGVGQSALALWTAQLALCDAAEAPCGHCGACILFLAGNHPDFHLIEVEEGASYIKVDQIRELASKLGMRSYRGRAKVGLIDPAERMNISSNNALLKTLEEPPEDTVLLLATARPERLAQTVRSRCQKIRIATPAEDHAIAWLASQERRADWPLLLQLAAGAPFRASELAASGVADLASEMGSALGLIGTRGFDPLGLADAWSKDRPAQRLAWLEHLVQAWIREASVSDAVNNNRDNALPSLPPRLNMRAAFELLDRVREARVLQEGSVNTLLLLEDLLVGFVEAFAGGSAVRPETQG